MLRRMTFLEHDGPRLDKHFQLHRTRLRRDHTPGCKIGITRILLERATDRLLGRHVRLHGVIEGEIQFTIFPPHGLPERVLIGRGRSLKNSALS